VVQIVLWYLDLGCSKHMTGNRSQLINFVSKFLGTVRFGNDQIAKIMGYAFKTKSWLWHQRLSHLNFSTLNQLAKQGLVRGLQKIKFKKDHLCSACSLGKSKKYSHKPKADDNNQEKLYLLHMNLCGPMRVESINGNKYILVIVNDYLRFTWVKFLRSKDEAPEVIIKCLKQIQVRLNATVRNIRTDNGTEFVNQTLKDYYENVRISHQTSVARTPQHNGVVKRWNRTLVEVARTMLMFSKAPLYLWAEAVSTTCYAQMYFLIRLCYNKNPYELMHDKKPYLSFLYVFGSLCYLTNDNEDLGELKPKADIGFVPNPTSSTPYVPSTKNDWVILFQPMIDEFFNPPPSVVSPVLACEERLQSAQFETTPFQDTPSEESSSNVQSSHTPLELLSKWTKNYTLANMIGDPSQLVSTRNQLKIDAMWCYFDVFLTSVEANNFKEEMLKSSWIESMQEEIHEFERLQVWELVPYPYLVMLIKLKWVYKVKKDELGGVLKNKFDWLLNDTVKKRGLILRNHLHLLSD
ncbi:retrovirus-related pol polyprotein from transposon TNT 1-94, partial [Tanacetum coccineum]